MVRHRATGRKTNAAATDRRRAMETHRAAVAEEAQAQAPHRAPAAVRPSGVDWYFVRAQIRHSLGDAAQRDGLRLGHDLLASSQGVAKGARLGSVAPAATVQVARGREVGLFPGDSRQFFDPRGLIGGFRDQVLPVRLQLSLQRLLEGFPVDARYEFQLDTRQLADTLESPLRRADIHDTEAPARLDTPQAARN